MAATSMPESRRSRTSAHELPRLNAPRRLTSAFAAKALADAYQHRFDLAHADRSRNSHREKTGDRAHRDLGAAADAEPHDHDREENDLRRRSQIMQIRLEGFAQGAVTAQQQADGDT